MNGLPNPIGGLKDGFLSVAICDVMSRSSASDENIFKCPLHGLGLDPRSTAIKQANGEYDAR
jgi:hypothetical protein